MLYLHELSNSINETGRSCPERVLQLLSFTIKLGRQTTSLTGPPAIGPPAHLRQMELVGYAFLKLHVWHHHIKFNE